MGVCQSFARVIKLKQRHAVRQFSIETIMSGAIRNDDFHTWIITMHSGLREGPLGNLVQQTVTS